MVGGVSDPAVARRRAAATASGASVARSGRLRGPLRGIGGTASTSRRRGRGCCSPRRRKSAALSLLPPCSRARSTRAGVAVVGRRGRGVARQRSGGGPVRGRRSVRRELPPVPHPAPWPGALATGSKAAAESAAMRGTSVPAAQAKVRTGLRVVPFSESSTAWLMSSKAHVFTSLSKGKRPCW